jgi:hypothetical protein
MMTLGSKQLFEIIVGAWEVRDLIAMKEPRPVTLRHFAEVLQHGSEGRTAELLGACHSPQQRPQMALDACPLELLGIGEYLGGAFHPAIGGADQRPQRRRSS